MSLAWECYLNQYTCLIIIIISGACHGGLCLRQKQYRTGCLSSLGTEWLTEHTHCVNRRCQHVGNYRPVSICRALIVCPYVTTYSSSSCFDLHRTLLNTTRPSCFRDLFSRFPHPSPGVTCTRMTVYIVSIVKQLRLFSKTSFCFVPFLCPYVIINININVQLWA